MAGSRVGRIEARHRSAPGPDERLVSPSSQFLIGINSVCSRRPTLAKLPSNGEVRLCRGAFAVMSASPS